MDSSMFSDLYKGWLLLIVIVAGCCFGIGYGCHACDYRPHFEMRKTVPNG